MMGLLVAAGLAALAALVHIVVGTREVRAPLMAATIDAPPRATLWYAWHVTSVLLIAMTLGFLWAGLDPAAFEAGVIAALGAAGCAIWGIMCKAQTGATWMELPQGPFFGLIAFAALFGLIGRGAS